MDLQPVPSIGVRLAARVPMNARIALLAFAVFVAALMYVMAPMASAQFSHVDDHEIAVIIGPSQHIALTDVPGKIAQYAIETNGRFRPGYFTLRVLEATFAGTYVPIWYLDRFILALLAGAALLALAYGYVTRLPLIVLPLMLIAGPQAEMWTRLGPQETYAVPMILAGLALWRWRHQTAGLAFLLAAGLVKESFVLLIPAVMAWMAWRQGRQAWKSILCVGIVGGLEAAAVAVEMLRYGDFYAQTRTLASIVAAAGTMLGQFSVDNGWYIAGLLGLGAAVSIRSGERPRPALILAAAAFILVFVPQAYFYGGNPPDIEGRYLAPAMFFAILVAGLGYWVAEGAHGSRIWLSASLVVALASGLLMVPQLRTAHQAAAGFSAGTRSFQAGVRNVEDLIRADPSVWIVVRPGELLPYYEVDFSVTEFLNNGPVPPQHIGLDAPPLPDNPTALEHRLNTTLETISAQGGHGFEALPAGLVANRCIEINFGQARADPRCTRVVVITGV